MIAFSSKNHLYVIVLTGFIKGSTTFSQIVKRVHNPEKVGSHRFVSSFRNERHVSGRIPFVANSIHGSSKVKQNYTCSDIPVSWTEATPKVLRISKVLFFDFSHTFFLQFHRCNATAWHVWNRHISAVPIKGPDEMHVPIKTPWYVLRLEPKTVVCNYGHRTLYYLTTKDSSRPCPSCKIAWVRRERQVRGVLLLSQNLDLFAAEGWKKISYVYWFMLDSGP